MAWAGGARAEAPTQLSSVFPASENSTAISAADASASDLAIVRSTLVAGRGGPPQYLISIYKRAAARYLVPWEILAAINAIETNYGRDLSDSTTSAVGWMGFVPSTWRAYAVNADRYGEPVPYDPIDAIFTAAHYLTAHGAVANLPRALFAYNHAVWYVDAVLWEAAAIRGSAVDPNARAFVSAGGMTSPTASSITLAEAVAVARSSATAAASRPSIGMPTPVATAGILVPQTSWNPELKPIAAWIVPVLQWASENGWTGTVTSGYRTYAEQAAINASGLYSAPAGQSNHETTAYPGGAVDVTEPSQLIGVLRNYPGPLKLVGGKLGAVDPEHFSATGD